MTSFQLFKNFNDTGLNIIQKIIHNKSSSRNKFTYIFERQDRNDVVYSSNAHWAEILFKFISNAYEEKISYIDLDEHGGWYYYLLKVIGNVNDIHAVVLFTYQGRTHVINFHEYSEDKVRFMLIRYAQALRVGINLQIDSDFELMTFFPNIKVKVVKN